MSQTTDCDSGVTLQQITYGAAWRMSDWRQLARFVSVCVKNRHQEVTAQLAPKSPPEPQADRHITIKRHLLDQSKREGFLTWVFFNLQCPIFLPSTWLPLQRTIETETQKNQITRFDKCFTRSQPTNSPPLISPSHTTTHEVTRHAPT